MRTVCVRRFNAVIILHCRASIMIELDETAGVTVWPSRARPGSESSVQCLNNRHGATVNHHSDWPKAAGTDSCTHDRRIR